MSFFEELKRRNVIRVGIAYVVVAWLVLQFADVVLNNIQAPDWVFQVIMLVLGIGFPVVLIFAWAFEMTPEGIKKEKDVDRSQSITPKTGRKLDYAIIGVLVIGIVYLLADKFLLSDSTETYTENVSAETSAINMPTLRQDADTSPASPNSIAVLPFVNMSADADNEYFSDGISEELLNVLVKVNALRVASRTSSFNYKGSSLSMSEIARELDVGHILEGSVRKAGNRVRITAQLINAKTDRHIWSETYERELDDIFDIQEEISNHIVEALKIALNVDEKNAIERGVRPTQNTEAYELYLQGNYALRQRQEDNIRRAIKLFDQAITLDKDFARAHEALAVAWAVMPAWSDMGNAEAGLQAKPAAIRALQLDPKLSLARAVLAESAFDEHRWADGLDEYHQAITNEPRNPTLHQWLGEALGSLGFSARGLEELRIAYQLDPTSPVINQSMTWLASLNREDDLALEHAEITRRLGLEERAIFNAIESLERKGEWATVIAWLDRQDDVPAIDRSCILARQDSELRNELGTLLDDYLAGLGDTQPPQELADCLALAGRPERGARLALLDVDDDWQAILVFWPSNISSGAMRQTEPFREVLDHLGLLDYYRETGWPDLCHPVGKEDFECDT